MSKEAKRGLKLLGEEGSLAAGSGICSEGPSLPAVAISLFFLQTCISLKIVNIMLFSHSVVSDSLWPLRLQHSRLLCLLDFAQTISTESVMLSNHLILCLLFLLLSSVFPSIRVFSSESALHIRWLNCWSLNICLSNEYSGLIFLGLTSLIFLQQRDSVGVFFSTTVQKYQFFSAKPSLWSNP